MEITELLSFAQKNKASDLHLVGGKEPMVRIDGCANSNVSTGASI